MKRLTLILLFLCMTLVNLFAGSADFQLVDKWDLGDVYFGYIAGSTIDKDGHPVLCVVQVGFRLITPEKIVPFAPDGDGPGEVRSYLAFVHLGNDIGIVERVDKLQVFTKKNGTYVWKENFRFKRNPFPFFIKDAVYHENKWYYAGEGASNFDMKVLKYFFIEVYDQQRKPLKTLLHGETREKDQRSLMSHYIVPNHDRLFYMREDDLSLTVISSKDATVLKTIKLERPACYKPLPKDFYVFKRYNDITREMPIDMENWRTGYSRISKVVIQNNYLVLQIRSGNEKTKKFCLLFYNLNTYKLEKEIFLDDFFLGARDGKYLFFKNGDPSLDDDTDRCIILTYQFGASTKK